MHYQSSFEKGKHDIKIHMYMCTIKEVIQKKSKRDQFPDSFKVNWEMVYGKHIWPINLILFFNKTSNFQTTNTNNKNNFSE